MSTGLNRLAVRIGELLAHERETLADLSHRLRTPLTALRIDAESLRDEEEMARVTSDVDALTRTVNEIIREARRPSADGAGAAACDAADVVRGRAAFWRALAEDQERPMTVDIAAGRAAGPGAAQDLAACVDILLENVFAHTPEGAAFASGLSGRAGGGAWLVVTDDGPGFRDPDPTTRGRPAAAPPGSAWTSPAGSPRPRRYAAARSLAAGWRRGHRRARARRSRGAAGAAARPRAAAPAARARRAEEIRLAAELSEWTAIAGHDLNSR